MAEEGITIEGEGSGYDASPERVAQAQEERARRDGWKPLSEFKGDPADWVDAKEFNGRKSLFEKISSLKSELSSQRKSFDSDMATIKAYVQNMSKIEYERAVKDLKASRTEAIVERDVEAVERIDKEIEQLQKNRVVEPPKQNAQEPNEKFEAWKTQNKWYVEDADLQQEANAIGIGYGASHPTATPEAVFSYVEKTIKKLYPEKFEEPKLTTEKKNPAVDAGGISPNAGTTPRGDRFTEADLTSDQQRVMNTLVKRGVVTKEQYLSQMKDALQGAHKEFREYGDKKGAK
jgi:hypothetical protein